MEQSEIEVTCVKSQRRLASGSLKGGDPFVLADVPKKCWPWIKLKISYEVVPGVTAALACAAYAGIPLSHRILGLLFFSYRA